MDITSLIDSYSYLAIFLLMTLNGATNLPSSQLLYVALGYFVGTGTVSFIPTALAGALGNTLGNVITFLLIKKHGVTLAHKLLMVDEQAFAKIHTSLHKTFTKKGLWFIFLGKLTPSIKAFIPIVAGLANTGTKITTLIFALSSFLWACMILSIGYFFGKNVSLTSFTAVSLVVGGTILFFVYKSLKKQNVL